MARRVNSGKNQLGPLHPRVMNSTPPFALYDHLSVRRLRLRRRDFIIHFWPLARRQEAVLNMMIKYDALSKRPPPRFTWRSLSRLKFEWPGRASATLRDRASLDEF